LILSIIIPAYNEEKYLSHTIKKLVDAIGELDIKASEWEIIVCDNNSSDSTSKIATQLGAKVIFEQENHISKARNAGASIANGEWLLFVDADTYPNNALMKEVLEIIRKDELIGCGVTVLVEGGSTFNQLRMERLNPLFRFLKIAGGAFLLSKKSGFNKINGFSNGLYAYEEFDFIFRLKRYGKRIGKGFEILHKHPVITSGRKGEINLASITKMIFSNFLAIILFALYYIFPTKIIQKMGKRFLFFWYKSR
jgi:glycosyltransferase involved in cell wall biosynthesis